MSEDAKALADKVIGLTAGVALLNEENKKLRADLAAARAERDEARREVEAEKKRQHREFWDVENERQAVCLAVEHHSNSSTPVSYIVREKMAELRAAEAQRDDLQKRLDEAVPRIVEDTLADVADFTDGRVTFASDAIDRFIERAIARAASQSKRPSDAQS